MNYREWRAEWRKSRIALTSAICLETVGRASVLLSSNPSPAAPAARELSANWPIRQYLGGCDGVTLGMRRRLGFTVESRYRPLLVVTPAFNEADTLDAVVAAVARQTRRPDEWVIVDDGSTDETAACIRRAASRYPWIRFVALTDPAWTTADRLAEARPARAFSAGVASATITWGYVAKLDADVQLPPDYYEFLLGKLATDPELGMTGGTLVEPAANGHDRVISVPSQHVPGAVSVYRRSCFERIGGVRETLGWDTVDETLARMHGFTTRSYRDVVARHLRPTGAVSGVVRGRARHGKAAWIVHYPLYFAFLRALKLTLVSPRPLLGFAFLWGYLGAAAGRVTRIPDADYQAYARRELRARTLQRFRVRT